MSSWEEYKKKKKGDNKTSSNDSKISSWEKYKQEKQNTTSKKESLPTANEIKKEDNTNKKVSIQTTVGPVQTNNTNNSWRKVNTKKTSIKEIANEIAEHQEEKEEKNKFVNKSGLSTIASSIGHVAKSTGAGVLTGTAGIAQGILTDTANQLNKGSEKDIKETSIDLGKALLNLATPGSNINAMTDSVSNMIKNTLPIIADKDKSVLEKGTQLVMNATSEAKNYNAIGKLINSSLQTIRKY